MFLTLLVEDNTVFRRQIRSILCSKCPSLEILEAGDAVEGMRKVDEFRPELVIVDITLPGESGLKLTKRIKSSYPSTSVIILSGHDLPEYRRAALNFGAEAYIAKESGSVEELLLVVEDKMHVEQKI